MINFGILTISDKGSRGERYDGSGAVIQDRVAILGGRVVRYDIVPDEVDIIRHRLIEWADVGDVDIILTTGGTGLGPRDVTPEATRAVIEKYVPGIGEAMRMKSLSITPRAMLSRGISGIRGNTLIVNLPGSPKAVRESLEYIITELEHGIKILIGEDSECAR